MKRKTTFSCIVAALSVGLIGLSACHEVKEETSAGEYETMQANRTTKSLHSRFSATLKGKQDVEIRPQVSGTITELCVEEGARVIKGQPLCIIDQIPYQAALETAIANVKVAEANVATARMTAESKEQLFSKNIISALEKQTAVNTLKSQEASLALAKAQETNARNDLSYTVVKSPVNGKAGMFPYKVGALVGPTMNSPLTSVSDNSEIYAYFSMTEKEILNLSRQAGSLEKALQNMPPIGLILSDGSTYAYKGKVDAVSSVVDASTGALSLRATFPNSEHIIPSGSTGTVIFPFEQADCIVIPQNATYEVQDKLYVYKVVDGKAVSALISIFPVDDGQEYIVTEGLEEGDIIVTEGVGTLKEGTPITSAAEKIEKANH